MRGARLACLLALLLPPLAAAARELPAASSSIEVAFTPWDDAEGALLRAVASARRAIYVQAYLLNSRPLARALLEARRRGVAVEILADKEMTAKSEGSQIPLLAAAGIPVFVEVRYAAAHNKIILVDPEEATGAVVTGSYNFTFSAQARNAENLLIIRAHPELARAYLHNWRRHRAEALPLAEALPEMH
jgi:phosphatidylserine/phosphatidylglycerophosphate/cardiolipin synthase-like enzyme